MFDEQERVILLKNAEFVRALENFKGGPDAIAALAELGHRILPSRVNREWPPRPHENPPAS
jgi:hypothetical protein